MVDAENGYNFRGINHFLSQCASDIQYTHARARVDMCAYSE